MPFKVGDSNINRDGRPKGSGLTLTPLLKAKLEEVPEGQKETYKVLFIKRILKKAIIDGDDKSLRLIINYVDGLPKQTIDLVGDLYQHTKMTSEERKKINSMFPNLNARKDNGKTN